MRTTLHRVAVTLAITLMPAVALASGDDGAIITSTIFHAINLAILIGIIVYFGRKPVGAFLSARKAKVTHDLEEAARLRAEAQELLTRYQGQIASLDTEREALMADYRAMGESERDRIIAAANREADRIAKETENSMEREVTRAKAALEAEVIELAAQIAERALREKLDTRGHAKLVDSYVAGLEADGI